MTSKSNNRIIDLMPGTVNLMDKVCNKGLVYVTCCLPMATNAVHPGELTDELSGGDVDQLVKWCKTLEGIYRIRLVLPDGRIGVVQGNKNWKLLRPRLERWYARRQKEGKLP